jgi:hypothetical protein
MNDVFFLIAGVVAIFLIAVCMYLLERIGECWHKWDKWIVWQTDTAYCQGRKCTKCGHQQVIQTRKMNDGHTNS